MVVYSVGGYTGYGWMQVRLCSQPAFKSTTRTGQTEGKEREPSSMFAPPPAEYVAESWRRWHAKAASEAASAAKKAAETETATAAPNTVHHAGCLSQLSQPSNSHADCALASFFCLPPQSDSELSALSFADSPPHRRRKLKRRGWDYSHLLARRRKAQMRLVNVRRGRKPRSGEPKYLQMFIDDVNSALQRPRGADGTFVSRPPGGSVPPEGGGVHSRS